jgi:hypothetical protein
MIGRVYDDLRSAIRLIAGTRALSFVIFVSLALEIGASTFDICRLALPSVAAASGP